jgi:TonB family protein
MNTPAFAIARLARPGLLGAGLAVLLSACAGWWEPSAGSARPVAAAPAASSGTPAVNPVWAVNQCPESELRPPDLSRGFSVKTRVHVQVDARGRPQSSTVAQSSGYASFDQAVSRHAMACNYRPMPGAQPVAGLGVMEIEIRVQ